MGYRAYVCTEYTVKYGLGNLNNRSYEIKNLIKRLDEETFINIEETDTVEYWEINPSRLETIVSSLNTGNVPEGLIPYGYTVNQLIAIFRTWLEDYDKNNDFIRVEWF